MNPHSLTGTVACWKSHGVTHFLIHCDNHTCMRIGRLKLANYFDNNTMEGIRKVVYCTACRAAGRDDRNLDIRPEWPTVAGPGRNQESA